MGMVTLTIVQLYNRQERYWPDLLDKMRSAKEFDHVLLKSDYWKKFEGTVLKQGIYMYVYSNPTYNPITVSPYNPIDSKMQDGTQAECGDTLCLVFI